MFSINVRDRWILWRVVNLTFFFVITILGTIVRSLTSIFLIMTLLPLVYKKFFPLGSPPSTSGVPRWVRGSVANIYSVRGEMICYQRLQHDATIHIIFQDESSSSVRVQFIPLASFQTVVITLFWALWASKVCLEIVSRVTAQENYLFPYIHKQTRLLWGEVKNR